MAGSPLQFECVIHWEFIVFRWRPGLLTPSQTPSYATEYWPRNRSVKKATLIRVVR
jgi:hypothetical protein